MKSPKLYKVKKIPMRKLIDSSFSLTLDKEEVELYTIDQQDNQLFRHIRNITNSNSKYNNYFVFVDCSSFRKKAIELSKIVNDGFILNNTKYSLSERSASMSRNGILGFVDNSIKDRLDEIISMGKNIDKTVISKYVAYRGLQLSSSFSLEEYKPKIVIVADYQKSIDNQTIKFLDDDEVEYIQKETGEKRIWKQKKIAQKKHDVELSIFDGAGIHHPNVTDKIKEIIDMDETPSSIMWRAPFIKGVTHSFNYTDYLESRGVFEITDIFGVKHSIYDEMIIMTEGMYKGYKYFHKYGDIRDWNDYCDKFKKYNHVLGVSKWNYSFEKEPVMTRMNYQVLQTLDLKFEEFKKLAEYSMEWFNRISRGDLTYSYIFLGLLGSSKGIPKNEYMQALLKDNEMLKDPHIKKYLNSLIKKMVNDFKYGKIWVDGRFKILSPDLIMLCEWIGGIEPKGILKKGEFYANNIEGYCDGEYALERNPHISDDESVLLDGVNNDTLEKYCGHLSNVLMINGHDITTARLSGADNDGDLVLLTNNEVLLSGISKKNAIPVIDVEDKVTVEKKEYNNDNILESIMFGFDNRIGELSNIATCYWNKNSKNEKSKNRHKEYIDFISVANGKEIDSVKNGVKFNLPKYISKYRGNYPAFMKYISEYYQKHKEFNNSNSNMNMLSRHISKFEKKLSIDNQKAEKNKNKENKFNFTIMQDNEVKIDEIILKEIDDIFIDFNKRMSELKKENYLSKIYSNYKKTYSHLSKEDLMNSNINWKVYYLKYRKKVDNVFKRHNIDIVDTIIATYLVETCYKNHSSKSKSFAWALEPDGILKNIKQKNVKLPIRDINGDYEYLGKRYSVITSDEGKIC